MPETTTVVCLKGRIREFGLSLGLAPAGHVYCGRRFTMGGWRLPQSDWANPFTVKEAGSAQAAVGLYEAWMAEPAQAGLRARIVPELRGAVLLCWCGEGKPCHARRLAGWAEYGFPGEASFDIDRWIDFHGRIDDTPSASRRYETVTPVGQWAGAL